MIKIECSELQPGDMIYVDSSNTTLIFPALVLKVTINRLTDGYDIANVLSITDCSIVTRCFVFSKGENFKVLRALK